MSGLRAGDLVVAPFMWSDGTCEYCKEGLFTSCDHGGFWASVGHDGGQGEAVRVPHADGSPPYEVRWTDDERTSLVFPGSDTTIVPSAPHGSRIARP